MKMAKVKQCDAVECAYNSQKHCHALAITVGHDAVHPMCDTFCLSTSKGGNSKILAGVGACKVCDCRFNTSLECSSPEILIGHQGDEIDCLTFRMR